MTDIDATKLRRLDLTVLLVFLGLMRHRKAIAVANELGLTQSAVSHSLKRLRDVFGDELFLRRPHGMEPTAVAEGLEEHVRSAVDSLQKALSDPQTFDPSSADRLVGIGAYDNELATLIPRFIQATGEEAPGLRISARAIGRRTALDALSAGDIDLAVGFFADLDEAFVATLLYAENYAVVGRQSEPAFAGGLSLENYASLPHILVSPGGDLRGIADEALERLGLTRKVVAAVPQFFPALAAVQASGCIATLPRRLALAYAPAFGLAVAEPPLALRGFHISAVCHRRDRYNPLHAWLISKLTYVCSGDGPPPVSG